MRFFSFSLLIGAGAVLGHLYLYRRLVRQLVPEGRWRNGAVAFLSVVTVLLLLRGPIRDIGSRVEQIYEVLAYSWMGFALYLVVATAAGDLVHVVLGVARRFRAPAEPAPAPAAPAPAPASASPAVSRRLVLQVVPLGVVTGGTAMTAYGSYRAFTPPEVNEVVVPLPKLPRTLDGLSVLQLTDVHVGSFIGPSFVQMLVDATNARKPDLVVITGDLVDGDVRTLAPAVSRLAGLRSRFGTFFVTGNHEYYSGELQWTRYLETLGIKVLRNSRVAIGDGGGHFDLIGVDDWTGARRRNRQGYDLEAAVAGRTPDRASILLAHQPGNFEVAAARGLDLQISGHTHGGQLFPMSRLVALHYPYHRGMYRHGDSRLYVSRGCGFWGPPSRVDSPPELVEYVLTSA